MSEPAAKVRSSVDYDEYDRRLHHNDASHDDPLAELARLVGEHHDPYEDVFAQEAELHRATDAGRREPLFGSAHDAMSPRLSGDFASIEAGLRGAMHPDHAGQGGHAQHGYDGEHEHEFYAQDQAYAEDGYHGQDPAFPAGQQWAPQRAVASSRSRRPIYAMVATIAVGVIGVGVAFAYKGTNSSPREIKTIMASSEPSKIQPPTDSARNQATQDAAILGAKQQNPTQLVSREEQPVDLSQAVQANTSRDADAGAGPGDASSVPVPPSPSQARGEIPPSILPDVATSASQSPSFGMSDMPAPKRVKVVSVRPDGTIVSDNPPSQAPAPRQASDRTDEAPQPVAKASTPRANASPKSTSRVAAVKPAPASADPTGDDVGQASKPAHKAKPQRVASVEPTTKTDDGGAAAAKSSGGFAVQLAAPGSEADARSASSRFSKKYADALDGRRIGFHKAQSNGKSVFRVRVSSLSREDAVSLCGKLKAAGGTCFVAKN